MPETFFGSLASKFWSAGTSDSDFELCILLREEEKFYYVLLVEIRHLIRLTTISREIKCCLLESENLRDIRKVYVTLSSHPKEISGGYCGGVPPLPIPNREVKPVCADGTAMQCGRVGGRLLLREP